MTGEWPVDQIDHINLIKNDNHWFNLRQASSSQNQFNIRRASRNSSGHKGVCWHVRDQKWVAQIRHNNRLISLGYHETKESAAEAYAKCAEALAGEFARIA